MIEVKADAKVARYQIPNPRWFQLGCFGQAWVGRDNTTNRQAFVKVLQPYERGPRADELELHDLEAQEFCPYTVSEDLFDGQMLPVVARNAFRLGLPLWPRATIDEIVQRSEYDWSGLREDIDGRRGWTWQQWLPEFEEILRLARAAGEVCRGQAPLIAPANLYLEEVPNAESGGGGAGGRAHRMLLMDVGLAYDATSFAATSHFDEHSLEGLAYVAPEALQALRDGHERGPDEIDVEREMVYSVAMTFAALLRGGLPFECGSVRQLLQSNGQRRTLLWDDIQNQRILSAFAKATDPRPGERFASLQEFRAALVEVPDWRDKDPLPKQIKIAIVAAAAAVVLAVALWVIDYTSTASRFRRSDDLEALRAAQIADPGGLAARLDAEWLPALADDWLFAGHRAALRFDTAPLGTTADVERLAGQLTAALRLAADAGEAAAAAQLGAWAEFLGFAYGIDVAGADAAPGPGSRAAVILAALEFVADGEPTVVGFSSLREALVDSPAGPLGADRAGRDSWVVQHLIAAAAAHAARATTDDDNALPRGQLRRSWKLAAESRAVRDAGGRPAHQRPQNPAAWDGYRRVGWAPGDDPVGVIQDLRFVVAKDARAGWRDALGAPRYLGLLGLYLDALERQAASEPDTAWAEIGELLAELTGGGDFFGDGDVLPMEALELDARQRRLVLAELPALVGASAARRQLAYQRARRWADLVGSGDRDWRGVAAVLLDHAYAGRDADPALRADALALWRQIEDPDGDLARTVAIGRPLTARQRELDSVVALDRLAWVIEQDEPGAEDEAARLDWLWTLRQLWSRRLALDPELGVFPAEAGFVDLLFARWNANADEAQPDRDDPLLRVLGEQFLGGSRHRLAPVARRAWARLIVQERPGDWKKAADLLAQDGDIWESKQLRIRIVRSNLPERPYLDRFANLLTLVKLIGDGPVAGDPNVGNPDASESAAAELADLRADLRRTLIAHHERTPFVVPEPAAVEFDLGLGVRQIAADAGFSIATLVRDITWNQPSDLDALVRVRMLCETDRGIDEALREAFVHFEVTDHRAMLAWSEQEVQARLREPLDGEEQARESLLAFMAWAVYRDTTLPKSERILFAVRLEPGNGNWLVEWLREIVAPAFSAHPYPARAYNMSREDGEPLPGDPKAAMLSWVATLRKEKSGEGSGSVDAELLWHRGFLALAVSEITSEEVMALYLPQAFLDLSALDGMLGGSYRPSVEVAQRLGLDRLVSADLADEDERARAMQLCVKLYLRRALSWVHRAEIRRPNGRDPITDAEARSMRKDLAAHIRELREELQLPDEITALVNGELGN